MMIVTKVVAFALAATLLLSLMVGWKAALRFIILAINLKGGLYFSRRTSCPGDRIHMLAPLISSALLINSSMRPTIIWVAIELMIVCCAEDSAEILKHVLEFTARNLLITVPCSLASKLVELEVRRAYQTSLSLL